MKLCQYYTKSEQREADLARRTPWEARVGLVVQDTLVPVTNCIDPNDTTLGLPLATKVIEWLESRSAWAKLDDWAAQHPSGGVSLREIFLGPPLLRPPALLDFHSFEPHAQAAAMIQGTQVAPEWYEQPVYYNGNTTALFGHGQRVAFPRDEDRMDFELELACVIGKRCRNVPPETAEDVIAGFCIMNDWSARSAQARGMKTGLGPACGKDHATSLGPCLVSRDEIDDLAGLTMRAYVNQELLWEGNSAAAHWTFGQMISFASRCRTLYPGTVIGSGTVGQGSGLAHDRFLRDGDTVRLEVDRLGVLENTIYVE